MGECIISRHGGGINTKDLPPQVTNLTLKAGNAKIDVTFRGVASNYLSLVKNYRVVYKENGIPQRPTDGSYKEIQPGTTGNATLTTALTGLKNDVRYGMRVFIRGINGWQTSPEPQGYATPIGLPAKKPLEQTTWEEIDIIAQANKAAEYWAVGATKDIVVAGETLTVEIVGFNHDDLVSGGKAKITFGLKNLMKDTRQMNSTTTNVGGFTGSKMYAWMQGTLLNSLPPDLKPHIKNVSKKTSVGNKSSTIHTNSMKLFLFSEIEVFSTTTYSFPGEGSQYSRFKTTSSRIKYLANGTGAVGWWWTRSPSTVNSDFFCGVGYNGGLSSGFNSSTLNGVCFGFCI